jgi:anti-sigma factor RsiW
MNHPDFEAYILGELSPAQRQEVEHYIASNPDAAVEIERLRLVVSALHNLAEEEPPRRIGFVSDKVFEPKWYQRFWQSAPQLGFASAAMLAVSIMVHGAMSVPQTHSAQPAPDVAAIVETELSKRLDSAVAKAVSDVRAESEVKSQKLVAVALEQAEKKFTIERQSDRLAVEASFEIMRKQMNRMLYLASNERGAQ